MTRFSSILSDSSTSPPSPMYTKLLPSTAISFLFSDRFHHALKTAAEKIAKTYNTKTAEDVIEEFRRMIALKVFVCDTNGEKMKPTEMMREIWLQAILNTRFYEELIKSLGVPMHYTSETDESTRDHELTSAAFMKATYKVYFYTEPLQHCHFIATPLPRTPKRSAKQVVDSLPTPKKSTTKAATKRKARASPAPMPDYLIDVIYPDESLKYIHVNDSMKVHEVIKEIQAQKAIDMTKYRLIHKGLNRTSVLEPSRKFADYDLFDGDQLRFGVVRDI